MDVLYDFPRRQQIEFEVLLVQLQVERLGDVTSEQVFAGHLSPMSSFVFERVIGPFETHGPPVQIAEIFHQLPPGTPKVEKGWCALNSVSPHDSVQEQDEASIGAVVVHRAVRREMIRRGKCHRVIRQQPNGAGGWQRSPSPPARSYQGKDEPINFVVDARMEASENSVKFASDEQLQRQKSILEEILDPEGRGRTTGRRWLRVAGLGRSRRSFDFALMIHEQSPIPLV